MQTGRDTISRVCAPGTTNQGRGRPFKDDSPTSKPQTKKERFALYVERLKGTPWEGKLRPPTTGPNAVGSSSEDEDPRMCRMTRGGGGSVSDRGGALSSFLHAQLMANKAPEFSGEEEDWVHFSQRWSDFVEVLRATEGREIEDVVLFGILESCVDDATKSKIRSERRREPGLNFSRFWQGLEREFGRDQESAKRGEWERVHLRSGEMTLASWRSYRIAFEAALSQTHGISEREVEQKVLRDLPSGLREKLAREIANKAQEKMWVKVLKSCNLKTQELAMVLGAILHDVPPKVEERVNDFLVACDSESFQIEMLELDGWTLESGEILRISWATRRPNWQDIVKWVEKTLRVDQEVRPIVEEIRSVHVITNPGGAPPVYANATRSGKGKGYQGKGQGWGVGFEVPPVTGSGKGAVQGNRPVSPKPYVPNTQPRYAPKGNSPVEMKPREVEGAAPPSPKPVENVQNGTESWGSDICFACQRAKRPCVHPYWECKLWADTKWGPQPDKSPESPKTQPDPTAVKGGGKGKGWGKGKGDGKGWGKGKGQGKGMTDGKGKGGYGRVDTPPVE